ncbi:hypothetical protein [Streptomyces scabiei]|uniref:Uncharacterized protein n=1 Tax=Streptomyces scabiei TaxID=1930 RepID=A0A100JQZ1_STRSC|nr:hypothetical protein [Streptomyces scabiei]GAQ64075.1 hypothetical protein SsS58_04465 [Streptomyces scabiei]
MSQTPARHLDQAAEQIRAFNHTSRAAGDGWQYPSDAYAAIGNLSHLAGMLGQAIEQSTGPVMRAYEHGRVRIDNGGDPDQKVSELVQAREDAMRAAAALTAAVQRMHNATSPMGMDTTGLPGFDDEDGDQP